MKIHNHTNLMRTLLVIITLATAAACATTGQGGIIHSDYGDCARMNRHAHNDHVFIGEYHDHALCEWLRYE